MRYIFTIAILLLLGTAIYFQPKTEQVPPVPGLPNKLVLPTPETIEEKTEEPPDISISQNLDISTSRYLDITPKDAKNTPAPAPTPTQTKIPAPTPKPPTLGPRVIDLRSVFGIYCDFESKSGEAARYRGSGVIIREGGYSEGTYILTNRHVVDIQWAKWLTDDPDIDPGLKLTECKVHILKAEGKIFPEERYPYPYYDLRYTSGVQYDFKARLAYLPRTEGLSKSEESELDYAILEVTGKNTSKYFENENPRLWSAPIFAPSSKEWVEMIKESRVVMPGYAFQQTGGAFEEFRLLTKDGVVKDMYTGDEGLKTTPLTMIVEIPPDAYGGRSGSPIFYKGYLIGLVATKALPAPNSGNFQSPQPTISAILENMKTRARIEDVFQTVVEFEE